MHLKHPFTAKYFSTIFPLLLVMLCDCAFTLLGQSKKYWNNYEKFNEASPLGAFLIAEHPLYFVLAFAAYVIVIHYLVVNLPRPFNVMIAIAVFLGHAWGSLTWAPTIAKRYLNLDYGEWYTTIAYLILLAIITGFVVNKKVLKQR